MKYKKIKGSLASGHKKTTEAGTEVLLAGGNIFDACVASAFAAPIAEPLLTSIAGGGLLMAKTPNKVQSYDFFVNYPGLSGLSERPFDLLTVNFSGGSQDFHIGPSTLAVPGNLIGLIITHHEKGRIPFKEVITPALEMAKNGIKVTKTQNMTFDLLEPLLSKSKEGKSLFYPNGKRIQTDDTFKNLPYSNFLEQLRKLENFDQLMSFVKTNFYGLILESMKGRSHISKKDLDDYQVKINTPITGHCLGKEFYSCPLPSLGGKAVFEILTKFLEDPLPQSYLSNEFIRQMGIVFQNFENTHKDEFFKKGTTHISGLDELGNACSLSMTNGEGCGEFISGTGIMLNNMLGEDDLCSPDINDWKPGERLGSMMAPLIIHDPKDPMDTIVLGAGGSKRIRSSLTLIALLINGYGMSLEEAIQYPRINFDGNSFQIEPGFKEESLNILSELAPINVWQEQDFYFGGVHGVRGLNSAWGDQRRDGFGKTVTS